MFRLPPAWHLFRLATLILVGIAATAAAKESDLIRQALEQYLQTQTQGLPGTVSYSIGQLDPAAQLTSCNAHEPFLPPNSRLWGKTTLGVRCLGPASWTIYVPVQIRIVGDYLVSTRTLTSGQVIGQADLTVRNGDLGTLPTGTLTDPAQALGKSARHGIGFGQPLRADQLLAPWAVQQGQSVKLVSKGSGFSVSNEGKALNNAAEGQVAQVRTTAGHVVSGIARPGGTVEISY
jgi:flagella basal body P-ring formation protein FlgA